MTVITMSRTEIDRMSVLQENRNVDAPIERINWFEARGMH
jgi:hypothetical protein